MVLKRVIEKGAQPMRELNDLMLNDYKALQSSLFALTQGGAENVYITNLDRSTMDRDGAYCLILEGERIELIERNPHAKNIIELDLKEGQIFLNKKEQDLSYFLNLSQRMRGIFTELEEKRASLFQEIGEA